MRSFKIGVMAGVATSTRMYLQALASGQLIVKNFAWRSCGGVSSQLQYGLPPLRLPRARHLLPLRVVQHMFTAPIVGRPTPLASIMLCPSLLLCPSRRSLRLASRRRPVAHRRRRRPRRRMARGAAFHIASQVASLGLTSSTRAMPCLEEIGRCALSANLPPCQVCLARRHREPCGGPSGG